MENEQIVQNYQNKYLLSTPLYSDMAGGLNTRVSPPQMAVNQSQVARNVIYNIASGALSARDGSVEGAYPIIMVSYLIGCQTYDDETVAENVRAYFTYVASADGQDVATKAGAGNAPISDELRTKVQAAIDTIK